MLPLGVIVVPLPSLANGLDNVRRAEFEINPRHIQKKRLRFAGRITNTESFYRYN